MRGKNLRRDNLMAHIFGPKLAVGKKDSPYNFSLAFFFPLVGFVISTVNGTMRHSGSFVFMKSWASSRNTKVPLTMPLVVTT
jgi:hypothetical protein